MRMSKKLYVLFLLVLVLVLAACGGDDKKDSKNVELKQSLTAESGLTVKYPDGWIARDSGMLVQIANNDKTAAAMNAGSESSTMQAGMAAVMLFSPEALADVQMEGKSVKEIAEQYKQIFAGESTTAGDVKDIKVGGKDAARIDISDTKSESEGFYVIYMIDDAHVLMAAGVAHKGELGKYEAAILKIIESVTYTAPAG